MNAGPSGRQSLASPYPKTERKCLYRNRTALIYPRALVSFRISRFIGEPEYYKCGMCSGQRKSASCSSDSFPSVRRSRSESAQAFNKKPRIVSGYLRTGSKLRSESILLSILFSGTYLGRDERLPRITDSRRNYVHEGPLDFTDVHGGNRNPDQCH